MNPSNYPRSPATPPEPPPAPLSTVMRAFGFGCVFVPVGLMTLAVVGWITLVGGRTRGNSAVGSGLQTPLIFVISGSLIAVSVAWLAGYPYGRWAAACVLTGILVLFVAVLSVLDLDAITFLALAAGAVLVVGGYLQDERPEP